MPAIAGAPRPAHNQICEIHLRVWKREGLTLCRRCGAAASASENEGANDIAVAAVVRVFVTVIHRCRRCRDHLPFYRSSEVQPAETSVQSLCKYKFETSRLVPTRTNTEIEFEMAFADSYASNGGNVNDDDDDDEDGDEEKANSPAPDAIRGYLRISVESSPFCQSDAAHYSMQQLLLRARVSPQSSKRHPMILTF